MAAMWALAACGEELHARARADAPAPRPGRVARVCLQSGTGGIGGGSLVRVLAERSDAFDVETLGHRRATIPATQSGQPTLCAVRPQRMRICDAREGQPGDVEVHGVVDPALPAVDTIPRGSPVDLYDYVDGGSPFAFVRVPDAARDAFAFVPSDEICHARALPDTSAVTARLGMHIRAAARNTFRPRDPSSITRIVIHNTEEDLDATLRAFASGVRPAAAHVVIDRDGQMYRVVEDKFSAFHAGGSVDQMGNFNIASLGVENVAYEGASGFTPAQEASLLALVRAWMSEYHITLDAETLANSSGREGYADFEYARAPLTIHRLIKASRGTDCPKFLFLDSAAGDEEFFRWREARLGTAPPG